MSGVLDPAPRSAHDHVVAFYAEEAGLATAVTGFVAESLDHGGTAIVVATPEHRASIRAALGSRASEDSTRYIDLDAEDTLDLVMADGAVDSAAFAATFDSMLVTAATRGPVNVFGEMSSLLWDQGLVAEAIDLEDLCNQCFRRHEFELLCAYPVAVIDGDGNLGPAKRVCDQHSHAVTLGEPRLIEPTNDTATHTFVPDPTALRLLRRFVGDVLDGWGLSEQRDDAQLIASELGTNATRHAASPFRITLIRRSKSITLSVRDASVDQPQPRNPGHIDSGGRGLVLIAQVADAWGTTIEPDGKTIWAELTL